MRKHFILVSAILLFLAGSVGAVEYYGTTSITMQPTSSIAYWGSYADMFANPATIPFREDTDRNFLLTFDLGDQLDLSYFGEEELPFLQKQYSDLLVSFGGSHLALTAAFSHDAASRFIDQGKLTFHVYSFTHLQIDWGFRLGPLSLGLRVQGGNRSERTSEVEDYLDALSQKYLGKYEILSGNEYFTTGVGLFFKHGFFSLGAYSSEVLAYGNGEALATSWRQIADSTSFAFAFRGPRFTSYGNLQIVRPRVSLALVNVQSDESTALLQTDFLFQLLPETEVSLAFGYECRYSINDPFELSSGTIDAQLAFHQSDFHVSTSLVVAAGDLFSGNIDALGYRIAFGYFH